MKKSLFQTLIVSFLVVCFANSLSAQEKKTVPDWRKLIGTDALTLEMVIDWEDGRYYRELSQAKKDGYLYRDFEGCDEPRITDREQILKTLTYEAKRRKVNAEWEKKLNHGVPTSAGQFRIYDAEIFVEIVWNANQEWIRIKPFVIPEGEVNVIELILKNAPSVFREYAWHNLGRDVQSVLMKNMDAPVYNRLLNLKGFSGGSIEIKEEKLYVSNQNGSKVIIASIKL